MAQESIIQELKEQNTLQLIILNMITLGIYGAFYIKRQSERINRFVDPSIHISKRFIDLLLGVSFISVILTVFSIKYADFPKHDIHLLTNLSSYLYGILLISWTFIARRSLHQQCAISVGDHRWFHGVATFFFTIFYFNYKINEIAMDEGDIQTLPMDQDSDLL